MIKLPIICQVLSIVLLAGMVSCSDDPLVLDHEITSALDYANVQHEFNQIALMFHLGAIMSDGLNQQIEMSGLLSLCSTIGIEALTSDSTRMYIDFGENCSCIDGKVRSGKLVGLFKGKWNQPESSVVITPIDYGVKTQTGKMLSFEFEQILQKAPMDNRTGFSIHNKVLDAHIISDDAKIFWSANQTIRWEVGMQTLEIDDDIFYISGDSQGVASNNIPFDVSMLQPLAISLSCPHTLGGVIAFTPEKKQTRVVDFGQGACDTEAEVEIAGFTRSISW